VGSTRRGVAVKRTPLKRKTSLTRTAFPSRGKPLPQRAAPLKAKRPKKAATAVEQPDGVGERVAKDRARRRAVGLCEIRLVGCFGRGKDFHHRLLSGQGGLWQASNGLFLCRWCHEAVTNTRGNRALYEANGWLIRANTVPAIVPATVPVLLWNDTRVLLDDVGDYLPVRAG